MLRKRTIIILLLIIIIVASMPSKENTLGSYENPAPMQRTGQFYIDIYDENGNSHDGLATIRLEEVARGEEVHRQLVQANKLSEEIPGGYEWAIIKVDFGVESENTSETYPIMLWFDAYDSVGVESPSQDVVLENDFGYAELRSGETHSGYKAILVPTEDYSGVRVSDWDLELYFAPKI